MRIIDALCMVTPCPTPHITKTPPTAVELTTFQASVGIGSEIGRLLVLLFLITILSYVSYVFIVTIISDLRKKIKQMQESRGIPKDGNE